MRNNNASEKAQSVQIGFIMILAIMVMMGGYLQTTIVPMEEEMVQWQHSQEVQDNFFELGDNINEVVSDGSQITQVFPVGEQYEGGYLFITPFPKIHGLDPQGRFNVEKFFVQEELFVINGVDNESNSNRANKWVSMMDEKQVQNGFVEYTVPYTRLNTNPTRVYENTVYYDIHNTSDSGVEYVVRSDQSIIEENDISIPLVVGDLTYESIDRDRVHFKPVSASNSYTTVYFEEEWKMNISTKLPVNKWRDLFEDEINNGKIIEIHGNNQTNPNQEIFQYVLEIEMEPGVYNINVGKVLVTVDRLDSSVPSPEPGFSSVSPEWSLEQEDYTSVKVRTFDEFGNPHPFDVEVNENGNGGFVNPSVTTTGEYGQYTILYEGSGSGRVEFTSSINE